jgi:hypothetical protein
MGSCCHSTFWQDRCFCLICCLPISTFHKLHSSVPRLRWAPFPVIHLWCDTSLNHYWWWCSLSTKILTFSAIISAICNSRTHNCLHLPHIFFIPRCCTTSAE